MTSKEEYLKKYLSGGGGEKKKKKKVRKKTASKSAVIILDDNPDWRNSGQSNDEDDSDTPIIVGKEYTVHNTPLATSYTTSQPQLKPAHTAVYTQCHVYHMIMYSSSTLMYYHIMYCVM